jgi:hypothetical protein
MKKTIKFLREKEWDMGNGQCDECCGNQPGEWAPHPCVPTPAHEGHEVGCGLAKALEELGEKVIYKTL